MSQIRLSSNISASNESVSVVIDKLANSTEDIRNTLLHLNQVVHVVQNESTLGVCLAEDLTDSTSGALMTAIVQVPAMQVGSLEIRNSCRVTGLIWLT